MEREIMKRQIEKALAVLQDVAKERSVPVSQGAQGGLAYLLYVFNNAQLNVRNTTAMLQDVLVHWDDAPEPVYKAAQTVHEAYAILGRMQVSDELPLLVEYEAGEYGTTRAYLAFPPKTIDGEVVLTLIDE